MKKIIEFLKAGLLVLLVIAMMPQVSYAADGDIFTILESKIYSTLMDLREIVYVIAGFGLVMFAVMAIFNKISYKHLSYIMIGLSLLSLMFPFIEYFSGYTTEALHQQRELTFKSYLDPSVSIQRVQGTSYQEVENPAYDGSIPEEELQAQLERDQAEMERRQQDWKDTRTRWAMENLNGGSGLMLDGDNLDIAQEVLEAAGCNPNAQSSKSSWDTKTGLRNVCYVDNKTGQVVVQKEVCQGKFNIDGTCSKTLLQTVGDIWSTVQNGIAFGQNLGNAFSSGTDLANSLINGEGSLYDRLREFGASGSGTMQINAILGNLMGASNSIGNTAGIWSTDFENNPTGANNTSDTLNALSQYLNGMQNSVTNNGSMVDTGRGVIDSGYNALGNAGHVGTTFSGAWSTLSGLFH